MKSTDRNKTILVTGALGYIGLHICALLCDRGFSVLAMDNESTCGPRALNALAVRAPQAKYVKCDVRERSRLAKFLREFRVSDVIHLGGVKSVSKSFDEIAHYLDVNVGGLLSLISAMDEVGIRKLIFSSSATVYSPDSPMPLREDMLLSSKPANPYAASKIKCEEILQYLTDIRSDWSIISLRYFNPLGACRSGLISEWINQDSTNLMPQILLAVSRPQGSLRVFGSNCETPDGTPIRDYVHVVDLANAHILALEKLREIDTFLPINLGSGVGLSVLEVISAFEQATGKIVSKKFEDARPGDVAVSVASNEFAKHYLKWVPSLDVYDMCESAWNSYQLDH